MTRDELVEKVARALCTDDSNPCGCATACKIGKAYAVKAIRIALEEAAKVAEAEAHEECNVAEQIATAIRAMIQGDKP